MTPNKDPQITALLRNAHRPTDLAKLMDDAAMLIEQQAAELSQLKADNQILEDSVTHFKVASEQLRAERDKYNNCITDDILEDVISEHDLEVPDGLLASPQGFGAHREAMRKALNKIIPLSIHIESEYQRAIKENKQLRAERVGLETWIAEAASYCIVEDSHASRIRLGVLDIIKSKLTRTEQTTEENKI